jgi:hypothetical protein
MNTFLFEIFLQHPSIILLIIHHTSFLETIKFSCTFYKLFLQLTVIMVAMVADL